MLSIHYPVGCVNDLWYQLQNFDRMKKDETDMWEDMDEEQRKTYGREYIEQHLKSAQQRGKMSKDSSVQGVIDAMVDALLSSEPKTRYKSRKLYQFADNMCHCFVQ